MTSPGRYDYCGLYLWGLSRDAAVELTAHATGAQRDGRLLRVGGVEIDVLRNPGFVPDDVDFSAWPVKVEVERGSATARQVVDAVSTTLTALWRAGYDAVAACDYEEELPDRGGYPRYRS